MHCVSSEDVNCWLMFQAYWRWLWKLDHGIEASDRQSLMRSFQSILNAESVPEAERLFQVAMENETAQKYPNWLSRLQGDWGRRRLWCLAFRGANMRGRQTNNYAEATIRVYKDLVLGRKMVLFQLSVNYSKFGFKIQNF